MKKKIISMILCVVTLFSISTGRVFAEDETEKTYILGLKDAIKMAVEKDPAFLSTDVTLKNAQRQLEQAYKDQRNIKGAIKIPEGIATVAVKQGYYVEQAKIGVESAKLSKKQLEAQISYIVTQAYYGVKFNEEMLKTAETAYELVLKNKNTVDMQFSLGMVSELDVKNAQYSLSEAKALVDKNKRSLEIARKTLAANLSIEDSSKLILTDDIEYKEFSGDLIKDTQNAMETRYDIYQLKSAYAQAEKYTKTTILLGASSAQHSAANQAKIVAEANYNKSRKQIAISINSSYNNILDTRDSLTLAEENLAIREQEYNVAVIQHELGMITNIQLTGILNNVTSAKIQLDNAKLAYKLAVEKYGYEITIGLGM